MVFESVVVKCHYVYEILQVVNNRQCKEKLWLSHGNYVNTKYCGIVAEPMMPISKTSAFQYIIDEYRCYQVTEKRTCKSPEEMNIMAKTYLCYLQSLRQNQELLNRYHSKGERTVEETARLVGLEVPSKIPDDKNT